MSAELRKHITRQLGALNTERSHYMDEWREMSDFVYGSRGRFLLSNNQKISDRRNPDLYNEVAKHSCNTLASGMMAGITSPARPWFRLGTADPDMMDYAPVKAWLTSVERLMLLIFSKSNIYNTLHSCYKEIGTFGQSPIGVFDNFDSVIHTESYTAGSYYIATNDLGVVDTFYREFTRTVGQLESKFGKDALSPETRRLFDKGQYQDKVEVIRCIEPNIGRNLDSPLSRDKRFRSVWIEKGSKSDHILHQGGFDTFPIMCPRWEVVGEDVYASSYPAIDCLNTNKSLQIEELDLAVAIEKQHNPPLIGDASLRNQGADLIAGGITWDSNMSGRQGRSQGLSPVYEVQPRVGELTMNIKEKEARIQRAFYADLFLMVTELDRAQITATEIAERKEEKMLMLGPVLERLHNELLDPLIQRVFEIAKNADLIPPPPPEIPDGIPNVEYVSVLAQAQKAVSTASMEATAAFAMQLSALNPEVVDKVNVEEMVDEHAKAKGAPPKTIRTDDEVSEIREARAQQAMAQQQADQAMAAVASAQQLSETSTDSGNALSDMMGLNG